MTKRIIQNIVVGFKHTFTGGCKEVESQHSHKDSHFENMGVSNIWDKGVNNKLCP
jgi:hypothetical protein